MFILPLANKTGKKKLPVATILIILINVVVFFTFQSGDERRYTGAAEYYIESGLAKIEIPEYVNHLKAKGKPADKPGIKEPPTARDYPRLHVLMAEDAAFLKKLRNETVIKPGSPVYEKWKSARTEYEALMSKVVFMRLGFKPAFPDLPSAFAHMFLHGGVMHLVGNMLFLWFTGCVLEMGFGAFFYMGMYIVTGLCSILLFGLVYPHSATPLVGASGAVSGLIGAYTVAYGRSRIKVFYSLGFYFNYTRLPAILLLPVWIGNEFAMLFFGGHSRVAYVAHIGGLVGGALIGYFNLKYVGSVDREMFKEDPIERIPELLDRAREHLSRLEMDKARPLLGEVLRIAPRNQSALNRLYNMDKLNPDTDRFHRTASRFLHILSTRAGDKELLYNTFRDYRGRSKSLGIGPDLLLTIASALTGAGYDGEAEKILATLLKNAPGTNHLPVSLLNLARSYMTAGNREKGAKCLRVIKVRYPKSAESRAADEILKTGSA